MEVTNEITEAVFVYLPDEASPAYGLKGKITDFNPVDVAGLVEVDFGTFTAVVSYDNLEFA